MRTIWLGWGEGENFWVAGNRTEYGKKSTESEIHIAFTMSKE